jgi:hypothetical protein
MAHRDDRDDRKRERSLSWREIDSLRQKSQSRDRDPMQKASSPAAINAQKSYRAALEKAFANGKLDELAKTLSGASDRRPEVRPPPQAPSPAPVAAAEPAADSPPPLPPAEPVIAPKNPEREQKQKLLTKIREAEGREPINKACDAFLAKYPQFPDDFEILTKVLAHRSDDRVREALAQLTKLMDRDKPRRGRTLVAQLRILEDTHADPEIRSHAAAVRGRL